MDILKGSGNQINRGTAAGTSAGPGDGRETGVDLTVIVGFYVMVGAQRNAGSGEIVY